MKTVRLENWSVVEISPSPYAAPEMSRMALKGDVYNHPTREDSSEVRTSNIVDIGGNKVRTQNTIYVLGKPDPNYIKFCKEKGYHVPTELEPILCK